MWEVQGVWTHWYVLDLLENFSLLSYDFSKQQLVPVKVPGQTTAVKVKAHAN